MTGESNNYLNYQVDETEKEALVPLNDGSLEYLKGLKVLNSKKLVNMQK